MTSTVDTVVEFEVRNPATGVVVARHRVDTEDDVRARVARARTAQAHWEALGFAGRRRHLTRWIRHLARHGDELVAIADRENSRAAMDVVNELFSGLEDARWAAVHARSVLRERRRPPGIGMLNFDARQEYRPLGVVGVITPWNAPVNLTMAGMAAALAAGNAVVVKPSELSPESGRFVVDAFHRANPELPEGIASCVLGLAETGTALCRSGVDKVAFTGSVATGRRVMATCAETLTPVVLELGGKDATVVAADADLEAAARAVVWGGLINAGQVCVGVERVYVVREVRDAFLELVRAEAEGLSAGTGESSTYGPMTMPQQIETVRRHVTEALAAGATALVGGPESIRPPFVDPIVLVDVPEHCSAVQEETFAPVVVVNTVTDEDEAVRRANGTAFGLGSSVFSASRGRQIAAGLRAGGTSINAVLVFAGIASMPFGGVGASGFGRFHGADGLREFSYTKSTARKRFDLGPDMQRFPTTRENYETVRRTLRIRYGRTLR